MKKETATARLKRERDYARSQVAGLSGEVGELRRKLERVRRCLLDDLGLRQAILDIVNEVVLGRQAWSEPHVVGTDPPTPENDPVGRFRGKT